ncbi:hypothetical protein ACFE04_030583 [Oxalis oulophora]
MEGTPPILHELKKQASFFFKDKIKTARLVLTDVTPIQLLTEEATDGDPRPPDTRTMGVISRAAFEVDDYWRIVEILHKRLAKFDRSHWRASYNALVLLEHLLTHGPQSLSLELETDKDTIEEMAYFQHIDEKGFNWGLSVRNLSKRVLRLLEDESFHREERARARKLTREIKGSGSFNQRPLSISSFRDELGSRPYGRCNSQYNDHVHDNQENENTSSDETLENNKDVTLEKIGTETSLEKDHPFCESESETSGSLLRKIYNNV